MDFSKIQELLNSLPNLLATIEALKAQAADAAALVEMEKKSSYDLGFADGVKSVPVSTKVYDQAEVDAMIEAAVAPIKADVDAKALEIETLKTKVAELEAAPKVDPEMEAKLDAALKEVEELRSMISQKADEIANMKIAQFKALLMEKYESQQVVETDSETGFKDLLK